MPPTVLVLWVEERKKIQKKVCGDDRSWPVRFFRTLSVFQRVFAGCAVLFAVLALIVQVIGWFEGDSLSLSWFLAVGALVCFVLLVGSDYVKRERDSLLEKGAKQDEVAFQTFRVLSERGEVKESNLSLLHEMVLRNKMASESSRAAFKNKLFGFLVTVVLACVLNAIVTVTNKGVPLSADPIALCMAVTLCVVALVLVVGLVWDVANCFRKKGLSLLEWDVLERDIETLLLK